MENYERALRGFEAAALKDPGLGADTEVEKIICLLDKLENAMKVSKNIKFAPVYNNAIFIAEFNINYLCHIHRMAAT